MKIPLKLMGLAALSLTLIPLRAAAQSFPMMPPSVGFSTAPQTPEQKELSKLMTENALEREKNFQRLKALTDERDELQLRSAIMTEKQKQATDDLDMQFKKLSLQGSLGDWKLKLETADLDSQIKKLSLQSTLIDQKARLETSEQDLLLKKLTLQNNLADQKLKLDTADLDAQLKALTLKNEIAAETEKASLADQRHALEKLSVDNQLKKEQVQTELIAAELEKAQIDLEMKRLDLKSRKLKYDAEETEAKTVSIKTDLDLRGKKEEWKKEANRDPDYLEQPFVDGRLTISDRRIPLNGPIIKGTADFVTERIEYFNNKSEKLPIFIVIDVCPGGSVMEGYRIVKAIRASKAPIHVVVKSFAASMAAVITTMAPHSYAYPNAIILHHQMSSILWGNMTMQKEQLDIAKEWYRRLAEPVAEKMGVSQEEMVKEMYKHNSEGDWQEFADKAQKLKWVDNIVHEIRETGIVKSPEDEAPAPKYFFMSAQQKEEVDAKGQRYVTLPRLDPFDFYYLYNPDQYYR
jgi:ATP-dependent Clp protease protease subunit